MEEVIKNCETCGAESKGTCSKCGEVCSCNSGVEDTETSETAEHTTE